MKFENKVVVLTGGVKGIGRCIKETFEKQGAHVCIIDVLDNDYFVGSIGNKEDLICFTNKVIKDYGHVDYIINNAKPIFKGIDSCSYEEFNEALQVGVTGPFMLVKLLKDYLKCSKRGCEKRIVPKKRSPVIEGKITGFSFNRAFR